jgi:hypothetical protein
MEALEIASCIRDQYVVPGDVIDAGVDIHLDETFAPREGGGG